jgi:AraC-like DNA-binding protein
MWRLWEDRQGWLREGYDRHSQQLAEMSRHIGPIGDEPPVIGVFALRVNGGHASHRCNTPHAYHLQRRVILAKELIADGHALSAVAATCGFADQSHFTFHFRRCNGVTPARFRASLPN